MPLLVSYAGFIKRSKAESGLGNKSRGAGRWTGGLG